MTTVAYTRPYPTQNFPTALTPTANCRIGGYASRSSSGGNRSLKRKFVNRYWSYVDSMVRTRVRAGKQYKDIVYKQRIRRYREVDPSTPLANFSEPHPYTLNREDSYSSPFRSTQYISATDRRVISDYYADPSDSMGTFLTDVYWTSNDDLILINKLSNRLTGSDFNPGVFLAEFPEACEMIRNAATRVSKAYSAYKRGKPITAWNHLTGSKPYKKFGISQSSNWLELQYGWLPLLNDAHDGAEFLAHNFSDIPQKKVVRSSRTIKRDLSSSAPAAFSKYSLLVRGAYKVTIQENNLPTLVGMLDPATILWEKLPYSFVLDWFLPIGAYLEARKFSANVTGVFEYTKLDKRKGYAWKPAPNTSVWSYSGGAHDRQIVNFSRTISTTLNVKLPAFKPLAQVAGWRHAANAVALITQKVQSR